MWAKDMFWKRKKKLFSNDSIYIKESNLEVPASSLYN